MQLILILVCLLPQRKYSGSGDKKEEMGIKLGWNHFILTFSIILSYTM